MSARSIFTRNAAGFKSNISVIPTPILKARDPSHTVSHFVLLGTKPALLSTSCIGSIPHFLSKHADVIKHTIDRTTKKKTSSIYLAQDENPSIYSKVTIGVLPEEYSRNICSTRPDVLVKLVRGIDFTLPDEENDNNGKADNGAEIMCAVDFTEATSETVCRSLITAIAKGFSHFTSKKRAPDGSFVNQQTSSVAVSFVSTASNSPHEVSLELGQKLEVIAECCQLCMFLVDAPPNLLDTTSFADVVVELAKHYDYKVHTHITGDKLQDENLTGIYNVGKCAVCPPKLIILQHNGNKNHMSDEESLVLVGKGITYDSGGLALKPAASMANMKCDMAGAALVFSTFLSMARTNNKKNIYAVLCLAENAIGPDAYRNDDIVPLYSGLHVEINNTDAEGRLVLADGLAYASKNLNPRHIFTLATLTGAQAFATGLSHAGVYANSKELEDECIEKGRETGDLTFPLLYCPEFLDEEFSSEVADLKNSVKNRNNASSSAAGRFLERSLHKDYKGGFAHLDIASPAFQKDRATGYGVNLLNALLEKL